VEEMQEVVQQNIEESKITTGQRQKDQDIWMEILKWLFCSCSVCGIRESKVMTQRPKILSAKVSTWVGFHWDT
jgi:hypothetical protein